MHHPRRRLFSTWLAILAIWVGAIAPSVSQALAFGAAQAAGASWVEVCGSTGSKWLRIDAAGQVLAESAQRPDDAPAASHDGACWYCGTHAASFALPPAPPSVWQALTFAAEPALDHPSAAPASTPWAAPAARAPPTTC